VPPNDFRERRVVAVTKERGEQFPVRPRIGGGATQKLGERVHVKIMSPQVERLARIYSLVVPQEKWQTDRAFPNGPERDCE
jgi:hypothetical protein